ncbi:hypothetical protein P171DRAFT_474239 [Karstenula rhodostoma CBS 690.94]|uniref:Opioid growth factor receptor (OGFr) conserved domain-containing protein n=1 Tax=Karstenula rhodostoma CBS 690.94 TaxID=1392251 RepID=A0A9P4PH79_9PLEO|nr:hypothetical protein P171DRAFT_474239 [Karstenula rhodostoma CBS 690.94]
MPPNATGRSGHPPSIIDFYNPHVNGKDAHGRTLEQMLKWNNDKLERCHDYIQILFPLPEGSMFSYNAPIIDKKTMEEFRSSGLLQMTLNHAFDRMMEFYGFEVVAILDSADSTNQAEEDAAAKDRKKQADEGKEKGKTTEVEEHAEDRNGSAASTASVNANPSVASPRDTKSLEKSVAFTGAHGLHVIRGPNFEERSKNWCVQMDHNHLRISRILRSLRVLGLQRQCEAFYEALTHVYNDPKIAIGKSSMMFWRRAAQEPLHIAPDGTECRWLKKWQETEQIQN